MKPYGIRNKILYNFKDNHPKKGEVNWWEADNSQPCKKRERQRAKKQIEKEIPLHDK